MRDHIHSLHDLELLLLLKNTAPRAWTAAQAAAELRTNASSVAATFAALARDGLLASAPEDGGLYVYSPASDAVDAAVVALRELYGERRLTVIDMIYSRHDRLDAIRAFADAFRVRGRDDS